MTTWVLAPLPPLLFADGHVFAGRTRAQGMAGKSEARAALERIARAHGGQVGNEAARNNGTAPWAAFGRASQALAAALACFEEVGPVGSALRMALHTGEVAAQQSGNGYGGATLDRATRLLFAAHPGQILCSEPTAVLLRREDTANACFSDLGLFRLHGAEISERLFQIHPPGTPGPPFPPPRAERL
jgi:class 3 adenylate cyclase